MATTYMDYPKMEKISSGLMDASQTLKVVLQVMDAVATALKATAFIGGIGLAAAKFIEMVLKPRVEELANKFESLSQRLDQAIATTRQAEQAGNSI